MYTLTAIDFDANEYANQAGGYLSEYSDYLGSIGQASGADVIEKIALENSINPRVLLALLEYQSGWVNSFPNNPKTEDYPFGYIDANEKGLLNQVKWAVNQLSLGYYGWREGRLRELKFNDGAITRLQPDLNAGTVALLYYFAQLNNSQDWLHITNPEVGFSALYEQMFGSPWVRANSV